QRYTVPLSTWPSLHSTCLHPANANITVYHPANVTLYQPPPGRRYTLQPPPGQRYTIQPPPGQRYTLPTSTLPTLHSTNLYPANVTL
ncbi:hypothetical protein LSAT2_005518, partial [Lamellibrachia satsuma]